MQQRGKIQMLDSLMNLSDYRRKTSIEITEIISYVRVIEREFL
jgi:hypothetical protein|nr:MAG TPA: hypothetical protein [Bacteriophage sp.]DAM76936.1 MAG TPA: hypothetical protein [Caudoviricetes sp.]